MLCCWCCVLLFVNKKFVLFFFWFLSFSSVFGKIPPIACPNYFQYFNENSRYIGRITLPNIKAGVTTVEVGLSQSGIVSTPNPSRITLYDSQAATVDKVLAAQPISYRVEFPTSNVLPKLTLISVNGAVLCANSNYPPPSSQLKLTHTLEMSAYSTLVPYSVHDKGNNGLNGNVANTFLPQQERPHQHQPYQPQQWQPAYTYTNNFFNPHTNFGINNFDKKLVNTAAAAAPTSTPTPAAVSTQSTPPPQQLNEICGRESVTFTPLIRGGSELRRGQFPWLTAIYRKKGTDLAFMCGGSLLSARTVISAAHCFKDQNIAADKILVLLGRHNLATIGEEGSIYRQVQNVNIHPDYNRKTISDADIAMLQLLLPVDFTTFIAPICLWNLASDISYIVGYTGFVAGWGATEKGDPVNLVPKKAATLIVDENSCYNSLKAYQSLSTSRTICARTDGDEGPCTGDSGGGLMIFEQGRWLLRGIISAGLTKYGQCTSNENFYFCDVAKHLSWIRSQVLSDVPLNKEK